MKAHTERGRERQSSIECDFFVWQKWRSNIRRSSASVMAPSHFGGSEKSVKQNKKNTMIETKVQKHTHQAKRWKSVFQIIVWDFLISNHNEWFCFWCIWFYSLCILLACGYIECVKKWREKKTTEEYCDRSAKHNSTANNLENCTKNENSNDKRKQKQIKSK